MDISSVVSNSASTASSGGTSILPQSAPTTPISSETSQTAAPEVSSQTPSPERVDQAIKQVNTSFAQKGQNLSASIKRDPVSGIAIVEILDKNTKEVIGQYPSKAIIEIADAFKQSQDANGKLINVRA